jgi:hypothetical protein
MQQIGVCDICKHAKKEPIERPCRDCVPPDDSKFKRSFWRTIRAILIILKEWFVYAYKAARQINRGVNK